MKKRGKTTNAGLFDAQKSRSSQLPSSNSEASWSTTRSSCSEPMRARSTSKSTQNLHFGAEKPLKPPQTPRFYMILYDFMVFSELKSLEKLPPRHLKGAWTLHDDLGALRRWVKLCRGVRHRVLQA